MKRKVLLSLFSFVLSINVFAQQYPVNIIPRVKAPTPVNFYNYADDTALDGPITVQIFLNDLTVSSRQIRLKTYFEGGNISFSSRDFVIGAQDLFIEGGIPLTLTNAELAPYYRFENIQGIGQNVYAQSIPEGTYNFCFEVYDFLSGAKLSDKKCATVFIFKNEPPILNLPFNGKNIEPSDFENIVFQWTPRHINVSNVEYDFSIVEIWDNNVDPQTAFLSQAPIYEETVRTTSLFYGPDKPLLLAGRKYAWRVRARALQGLEEIGLFKNEGYSEIFWFSRTAPCQIPEGVAGEPKGTSKINVFWDQDPTLHSEYIIAYREANNPDANWFTKKTNSAWATIWDLKAGTTYEFKVKGKCAYQYSEYSDLQYVTTDIVQNEDANYNCGIVPDEIAISNRDPHPGLNIGDQITAGDFKVTITDIQSQSNGIISGKGFVAIPYLKFAKFGVTFTNILVNTDGQLAEGEIVTLYDPEFGEGASMTVDVNVNISEGINGDSGELEDTVEVDFVVDTVEIDANGAIVVTGTNGETAIIPGDDDVNIVSSNGDVWSVGEDGTITKQEGAQGGVVSSDTTNGLDSSGNVTSITAKGIKIEFEPSGFYHFDKLPENTSATFESEYKILETESGKYRVPYKAISDNEGEDFINAKVTITDTSIVKDSIIFKTKDGAKVPVEWIGDRAKLSFKRKFDYVDEEIFAVVKSKNSNKYDIAGSIVTTHLASGKLEPINVTVVPVGIDKVSDEVKNGVKEIYAKAGVRLNIQDVNSISLDEIYGWDKDGDNRLSVGDSNLLSTYTSEEAVFNSYIKQQPYYNNKTYYVFVTNVPVTKTEVDGFMPLKRQFGFVFTRGASSQEKQIRTMAHELGHGIFGLKHTWDEYQFPQGATDHLMDYGNGTTLNHLDWKKIHAPGIKIYWFQGDEDGEHASYEYFASKVVVPGVFVSHLKDYNESSVSFVSSAGKLISLPSSVEDVTFHKNRQGQLLAFTLNENGQKVRYVSAVRSRGTVDESFAGYMKNFNVVAKGDWESYVYKDEISVKSSFPKTNVRVFLGELNGTPCGINLYETKIKNTSSGNWNSGGNKEPLSSTNYITGSTKVNENLIESSPACDFCEEGKKFFELHSSVDDEAILEVIRDISDLICDPNADTSFFKEYSDDKYDNLLAWQKRFYDEGIWSNDLDAYKGFYTAYSRYLKIYKKNRAILEKADQHTRDQVLQATYEFSWNQLKLLKAKDRAGMLRSILDGHVGGYWTGMNYNHEALVLNILKTVNDEKESGQTQKFLNYLVDENYKVGGDLLYKQLVDKVNDSFFGTDSNRLTLINQLTKLSLRAKGISLKQGLTLTSNQDYESLLSEAQCKGDFYWEVTNERFLWLFNVVNDKSKLEFDFVNDQKNIRLRQFCTDFKTEYYGEYASTKCVDWKIKGEFHPFELVALNIINDLTFTKASGACQNSNAVVCGQVMLVPAMFIDYLDRKRSNTTIQNGIFNTLTVASFYFSGASIIAARGAVTLATIPAYADLFVTIANPYFSDDKLFVAHASSIIESTFFDYDPSDEDAKKKAQAKAKELAKLLQMTWNFATIPLTLDTASSVVNPSKHIEAIATWKALVRKMGSVDEAKKVIANNPDLASKVAKGFNAAEDNIRSSANASKQLDTEIEKKLKELDNLLGNANNAINNLKNTLLNRLPDGSELKKLIQKLDPEDNASILGNIFDLSDTQLLNFNKIVTKQLNADELSDLFEAWRILSYRSPRIAKIPKNSEVLAKVHRRFSYSESDSFNGLHKLFNEGSQVQSKQKLIDQLKKADEYFDNSLPVQFSAIKKGDVKITIIDQKGKGAEVARYSDDVLVKKKAITEADGGTVVKKANKPEDDLLKKGDEIGFRKADNIPSKLSENGNIVRGSSTEYSLAKKRLKEYIEGEIYKIKKSGLPQTEQDELIRLLNKKNKAYMEGSIGNLKFDGNNVRKSGDTFDGDDIFSAYKVDKNGGINTPDSWIRNADTEYVMLSEIARDLGAKKGQVYSNIYGEIKIVSELPYCMSCQGVIQDFSDMFPNVKVVLIDNLKY